jgi:crossover junction endodeoxyribonuclease RuvC
LIILAIDPGMTTGWAIVTERGPIIWGERTLGPRHQHWAELATMLSGLVAEYHPDAIAWEEPVAQGIAGASLNRALGIIEMVAQEAGVPYASVNPSTLKKWLTGSGKADKAAMREALWGTHGAVAVTGENAVDACAVGLYARECVGWPEASHG